MSGSTDRTRASFGYEWSTFDQLHDEHHDYWRRYAGVGLHARDRWHGVVEKSASTPAAGDRR